MKEKMWLIDIFHLELWRPLCPAICAIFVEGILGTILLNYYEFGPVIQKEILFKDISYLEPCMPERNHLCNFVKGIMRNNSMK